MFGVVAGRGLATVVHPSVAKRSTLAYVGHDRVSIGACRRLESVDFTDARYRNSTHSWFRPNAQDHRIAAPDLMGITEYP